MPNESQRAPRSTLTLDLSRPNSAVLPPVEFVNGHFDPELLSAAGEAGRRATIAFAIDLVHDRVRAELHPAHWRVFDQAWKVFIAKVVSGMLRAQRRQASSVRSARRTAEWCTP